MSVIFWIVVAATLLSGFFSLTGAVLSELRRVQLEEAFAGQRGKTRLDWLLANLHTFRLLTSFCQAAANVALVLATVAMIDGPATAQRFLAAVGVSLALIAVFGVAIPHSWARHGGEQVLAATFWLITALRYLLYPVLILMQAMELPVRRLSGVSDQQDTDEAAKQELLQVASEAQAEGTVEPEEARMIASVIEFGDTEVGQIMTPRTDVFALPVDTTWADACQALVQAGHSRVPIYEDDLDNVIGVLYGKDLLHYVGSAQPADLRSVMRKAFFVPQTKNLDDLLREFKSRQVHIAVVLDEFGGTAGLVTIEDVLEEIVGEIADEYDRAEAALMTRIDESTVEIDGRLPVDELNEALALSIPEQTDYTTAAGMVFSEIGYIPTVGETLEAFGARFTVLAANERQITRLRVEKLPEKHEET